MLRLLNKGSTELTMTSTMSLRFTQSKSKLGKRFSLYNTPSLAKMLVDEYLPVMSLRSMYLLVPVALRATALLLIMLL